MNRDNESRVWTQEHGTRAQHCSLRAFDIDLQHIGRLQSFGEESTDGRDAHGFGTATQVKRLRRAVATEITEAVLVGDRQVEWSRIRESIPANVFFEEREVVGRRFEGVDVSVLADCAAGNERHIAVMRTELPEAIAG
jgi:hypothetical protein